MRNHLSKAHRSTVSSHRETIIRPYGAPSSRRRLTCGGSAALIISYPRFTVTRSATQWDPNSQKPEARSHQPVAGSNLAPEKKPSACPSGLIPPFSQAKNRLIYETVFSFPKRNYFAILATTPAPTVRPPSRIAKRWPSSMAIGVMSLTLISMLSPGMHISVPSGS